MDGLKLDKWKSNFADGIRSLQIEFDAFLLNKKLSEFYSLTEDEEGHDLVLKIEQRDEFPKEIKDRVIKMFESSKPEDSV